jgi:capsular polysaccharide export protein
MLAILSRGIARIPYLSTLLREEVRQIRNPYFVRATAFTAVAGWGRRPSTTKARAFAARHKLPFIALEDGFLRSCGLGVNGASPLSVVMDDLNIYYDASQPSRLEALIASLEMTPELHKEASRALNLIRQHRLSKYNHAPSRLLPAPARAQQRRVLVVDQTMGDVSVSLGGSDASAFGQLLAAALAENGDAQIWIKTHPDVISGKKQGYFGKDLYDTRIQLLADDVSPLSLLEQVDKVYVVTSQMGFEALMLGKPVVCFGQPWYAGWGLTDDRHPGMAVLKARRNRQRSLEELFAAAYLRYARYIEPATATPGTVFDVIAWLARNKDANDVTRGELWCVGMTWWKRAIVRPFLESPSTRVRFVGSVEQLARKTLAPDAKIVVWGIRHDIAARQLAAARNIPLWRMEDGFLRSVGLGSDLHRPVSLVLDRGGIYYDPASGSDLETMLATQTLSSEDLQRAARFRQASVSLRASKYNIGGQPFTVASGGRRVLLVPGQVEDDASVRCGSPIVTGNLALLRRVRENNPDAYIVYKPHPDVVAGNRSGELDALVMGGLADQCIINANIIDCILAVDEVHTMTSLSGFEALLHGRVVHCYGGPFYAGWGLTTDHFAMPHRQRKVSLDELVFAAMLQYPRYVLPGVRGLVSAEQVLARLVAQAARPAQVPRQKGLGGWIARKARKASALAELMHSRARATRS